MDRENLFVRINYRTENRNSDIDEVKNITNTKIRNGEVGSSKYLIGSGVYSRKGGTVVFKAKNLEEIKQVTAEKPLIKDAVIRYDVVIIPKTI